jgi:lysophospholipase L1-like esterase
MRWAPVLLVGVAALVIAVLLLPRDAGSPPRVPRATEFGGSQRTYIGHGSKVVVLGDSLTASEWYRLYGTLDQDHAVAITALVGEGYDRGTLATKFGPSGSLSFAAARYARMDPQVVVLAIGTNDAWNRRPIAPALAAMHAMVGGFHGACLVGVTLPEHSRVPGWSNAEAHVLNEATRGWADQIVDWASLSTRTGVLASDGIHTTTAGARLRADAIVAAIARCGT